MIHGGCSGGWSLHGIMRAVRSFCGLRCGRGLSRLRCLLVTWRCGLQVGWVGWFRAWRRFATAKQEKHALAFNPRQRISPRTSRRLELTPRGDFHGLPMRRGLMSSVHTATL